MVAYYWISFVVTFWLFLATPTRMTPINNFTGSLLCGLFGFLIWPLAVIAFIKIQKDRS